MVGQVAGVYRRRVGEVVVTALSDGSVILPAEALHGVDVAERDRLYREAGRRAPFRSAVNTFLLQWPGHTVLVDTGVGAAWGPASGRLLGNLHAAGVAPGEVDTVLMTHIHADHMGGLLDAAGAPVFSRAKLMVAEAEVAHWESDTARQAAPEAGRETFDAARRVMAPYRTQLHRFTDLAVVPNVTALPLPGHTPGHTGYEIRSGGEMLLIWGDIVHTPEVQAARPDVTVVYDFDPAQAQATRRAIMERAVAEDMLVTGMHMSFPGFARVARTGDGFALQWQPWEYDLPAG